MKRITIGFSTNTTILSWLIRVLTCSKVSHCYVRLDVPEYNSSVVFHAQGFKVHYVNFDRFKIKNKVIEELTIELTDREWARAEYFRVESCGKPYGFLELVGYIPVLLARAIGRRLGNPFYDKGKAYICVELICEMLNIDDRCTSTPQDLMNMLRSRSVIS